MNRLLPIMNWFSMSGVFIQRKEVTMTHKSRFVLGAAAALIGVALLGAPVDTYAKPDEAVSSKRDNDKDEDKDKKKKGTQHYKATICSDGKVYGGGPGNTRACKRGFTTVAGQVTYDGKKAKVSGRPTCLPSSRGPSNTVTWCGVADDGVPGRQRFISLGANGQMESTGETSSEVSGTVGGGGGGKKGKGGEGGGGEIGGSLGSSKQAVNSSAYWMRIDVRPNGTYNLRGGLNK
jgi:hypothetical protein